MLRVVPIILFAGAAAFVSSSELHDARATAAFKVPVVTIHAKDFAFDAPASIGAGQTTFRLVNDGAQLHHLVILKLDKGKSLADMQAAMKSEGPPPTWITAMGGPNAAVPGGSTEATVTLDAGSYVLLCFIPSPGEEMPHAAKGMMTGLTVTATGGVMQAGATYAPTPAPDVHLVLKDYSFAFSKPITAGKHTIHVMNEGPQDHEATIVQLAPGKHVGDFYTWASTGAMKGPPPGRPIGGLSNIAKGRTAIFTDDFTPGTYGIICFVPAPDHKMHADHGMVMEFEVK